MAKIEVDGAACGVDAEALVADVFGVAGGDIAGDEVTEAGVALFEEVVAVGFGDLGGGAGVAFLFGNPDATVVAQALAHEGEFGLVIAALGDAGGVDLDEAGVCEISAAAGAAPRRGDVGVSCVRGEIINVSVAAGAEEHGVGDVAFDGAGGQVSGDDAAGFAVDDDQVEHFLAGVHLDVAVVDLAHEGAVCAEEKLLSGLAAGVEGAGDLGAAEGAVGEDAGVFAGEGDALGDALVDDFDGDFGESVDVGFAGAEVAAFDGVVEEAVDGVAVVAIIFSCINPALGGDAVGTARTIEDGEGFDAVALFAEGGGGGGAGESSADDDHVIFAAVGRGDQFHLELVALPPRLDGA